MNYDLISPEDMMAVGYHCICIIDPESGYGRYILPEKATPPQWDPQHFPYDEVMHFLIDRNTTEEDIEAVARKMSLSAVTDALSRQNHYHVYYTCMGQDHAIDYRKASFMQKKDGSILFLLKDITGDLTELRLENIRLQEERYRAIQETSIANHILKLLDEDFRSQLFTLRELNETLEGEDIDIDYCSPLYTRVDQMMERSYVAGYHMLERLNDVRELQNIVRWGEELQSDLISIEDMLRFFDGPVNEQCDLSNTLFTWDISQLDHVDIIADEMLLSNVLLRLIRHVVVNSNPGGMVHLLVNEAADERDETGKRDHSETSAYTFSLLSDHCQLSTDQLADELTGFQGILKELQKNKDDIHYNLILLKKYIDLLGGSISILENEQGQQIDISFHFQWADSEGMAKTAAKAAGTADGTETAEEIADGTGTAEASADGTGMADASADGTGMAENSADGAGLAEEGLNHETATASELNVDKAEDQNNAFDFSGNSILLIDDNLINLEFASRMLRNAGFFVVNVENGHAGYEAFIQEQGDFDVIVLDLMMPDMSGYDLAQRIRKSGEKGAGIPIIALTSEDSPQELAQSEAAGINDHLTKPINPYSLLAMIRKYVK